MSSAVITLKDIVEKTADLPSFSNAALRVMHLAEQNSSSAEQLANVLAQDQALSVRVLRLANSAYYGMPRQIVHLPESVVVLGMRTVKNLAIVAATYPWMSKSLNGYGLGPEEMWNHSFGTALGAKTIATLSKRCDPDAAFTAGLLHDIGKVALNVWIGSKLKAIVYYAEREGIAFDAAERRILGFDHTEVGEYLGRNWNLPEDIVAAIRYHHRPNDAKPPLPIIDCVHIGGYLTMTMGLGLGGDGLRYELFSECFERLEIEPDDLDQITDNFVVAYEEYESMFKELAG
ncbi:MAG: HDOD domain-containing protein [Armatimonadetes bacterium]|nr:HDOD domain-containing protein [Armatimonadota bacterium]